jgi:hypothetical protein
MFMEKEIFIGRKEELQELEILLKKNRQAS